MVKALLLLVAALTVGTPAVSTTEGGCEVQSWEVRWGVKESFRAYLSGSIANGEWSTAGDVSYETPVFLFGGDTGAMGSDASSGDMVGSGSIRFTGHAGILDQTLSNPSLVFVDADTVDLVFDVYGATQEGVFVDQESVAFVRVDASDANVNAQEGVWEVVQASTVFTEAGHEAFGTYPAGEAFDPVDIRITVTPGCLAQSGISPVLIGALTSGVVALAAIVIVLARRWRGRERPAPGES